MPIIFTKPDTKRISCSYTWECLPKLPVVDLIVIVRSELDLPDSVSDEDAVKMALVVMIRNCMSEEYARKN